MSDSRRQIPDLSQGIQPDSLTPHVHEPNPLPPSDDAAIAVITSQDSEPDLYSVERLTKLPWHSAPNCYIVSTGHGTSGPFHFQGPLLSSLAQACGISTFTQVAVISGDSFGTLLSADEVLAAMPQTPVLLALKMDGKPLTRQQGLVRLIVPAEKDDALKQVKWVSQIWFEV